MKRFYKGNTVLIESGSDKYEISLPDGVTVKGLDVTYGGMVLFKAEVTDTQNTDIIALGNTEISSGNVVSEAQTLFGTLYTEEEIIEWRDN